MRRPHQPGTKQFRYGMELILDLDGCAPATIADADELRTFAAELVDRIGMRAYGPAIVEHFGHDNPVTSGYTLVQLIETSNISGHFSEALQRAHLNVFSCRTFDPDAAMDFAEKFFAAQQSTFTVILR